MMYVFICPLCGCARMIASKRFADCPVCGRAMANCEISYEDWVQLPEEERERLIAQYREAECGKLTYYRPNKHYDSRENNYYM